MKLIRQRTGAVLIEFCLCLPILVSLCFGMYELYRLYNVHITTYNIAAKIGMWSSVDTSKVTDYIQEGYNLGSNIKLQNQGTILVTGLITGNADKKGVNQTQWTKGSGTTEITGSYPLLSDASAFTLNYQTIVVDIVYNYKPLISLSFISPRTIRKTFCIDYRNDSSFFNPS